MLRAQDEPSAHARDASSDISVGDISLSEDDSTNSNNNSRVQSRPTLANRRKLAGIARQQHGGNERGTEKGSVKALAEFLARTGPEDFRLGHNVAPVQSGDDPSTLRKLFLNLRKAGSKENLIVRDKRKKKEVALADQQQQQQQQQQQKFRMLSVRYENATTSDNELESSSSAGIRTSESAGNKTVGMQKLQNLMRRSALMDSEQVTEDLNSSSLSNDNEDQGKQVHRIIQETIDNDRNTAVRTSWGTLDTVASVMTEVGHPSIAESRRSYDISSNNYSNSGPSHNLLSVSVPSKTNMSSAQQSLPSIPDELRGSPFISSLPKDVPLNNHDSKLMVPTRTDMHLASSPRSPTNTIMTMVAPSIAPVHDPFIANTSIISTAGGRSLGGDLPQNTRGPVRRKIRHVQTQTGSRGTVSHEVQTDALFSFEGDSTVSKDVGDDNSSTISLDPHMLSLLRTQNSSLHNNVSNLNGELNSTQVENASLLVRIKSLEYELSESRMQQVGLQSSHVELMTNQTDMRNEFSSLQQSYDEVYNEVQMRTSELEMYHTQLVANANTIQQLENTLFAERQAHEATREEFDTLSRQAYVKMKQLILERIDLVNEIDVWKMKLREANKLAADRHMEEMFTFGGGNMSGTNTNMTAMPNNTIPITQTSAANSVNNSLSSSPSNGQNLILPSSGMGGSSKLKQSASLMSLPTHIQKMNGSSNSANSSPSSSASSAMMMQSNTSPLMFNSQQNMNSGHGGGIGLGIPVGIAPGNNSGATPPINVGSKKVKFQEPLKPVLKKAVSASAIAQNYYQGGQQQQHQMNQPSQTSSLTLPNPMSLNMAQQQRLQQQQFQFQQMQMGMTGRTAPAYMGQMLPRRNMAPTTPGVFNSGNSYHDDDNIGTEDSDENTDSDDNELMSHDA